MKLSGSLKRETWLRSGVLLPCILLALVTGCTERDPATEPDGNHIQGHPVVLEVPSDYSGVRTATYANGQRSSEETYRGGQLDGPTTLWREDGSLEARVQYKNNWRHGVLSRWYPNGQLESEENWYEGNLHGPSRYWHENGQLAREWFYTNGEPSGTWKQWNDTGQLIDTEHHIALEDPK